MATPATAFVLTGFGDEIDDDLDAQLDLLESLGIGYLDLRSVGGTNVLDLDDERIDGIRRTLDRRGFGVSSIASPIGKVDVTGDFEAHLDRFRTALEMADAFETDYVRVFSYYLPDGDDREAWRDEVIRRMERKANLAEAAGVTLVHENEWDVWGDSPGRCRDLLASVDSPALRAAFDPANFVIGGDEPYPDGLRQLAEYVEYVHVKDATVDGEIRPPGEGDARVPEVLDALWKRGFSGFVSLEPHLVHAGAAGGYSGPEAFRDAARALVDVIEGIGGRYE